MAAEASAERRESKHEQSENKHNQFQSSGSINNVSRSSITFFNSENALIAAKAKLENLKQEIIPDQAEGVVASDVIETEDGQDVQEFKQKNEKEVEEKLIKRVLDFCVGGKFDLESRYVLQEPFNGLVFLELVYGCSTEKQLELLTLLQTLLKQSIKNLQACTKIGLIIKLLKKLPSFLDETVADKAIDLVGDLATYSITVRELKCFFASLQRTDEMKWPPHALKLLEILKKMPEKHGPDVYFNFAGKPGASITIPPISKWPHQPGFTFVTWLQLDAAHLSPAEQQNRPHVYSFLNSRGLGYAAHFSGPMLVVEVHGKNGKKQTILVKSKFEPQMWYHICVSHTYNRFKSSEVKVFVNGQMVTTGDVTMPSNKDTMDKCFLGGSHLDTSQHIFKGQMSGIYVFSEPLAYNTVIALYRLGPGYKGNFKFRNELESTIADTDKKLLYEGKLSHAILFTYNPKAVDGELCLESSPTENLSCFYHSPHAMMMQGVQAVVTHSLQAAMHSLGGIQMLFPLFAQLDCPLEGHIEPVPKICTILLGLIYDLLRGSSVCQQQMIQSQGFMIIGHLLQRSSPIHLTEATVDILLGLARYFMATASASGLLGGLLDHVLLEPSLWIKTPLSLQSNLLSLFATGYVGGLDYAGYIRKEVGVPRLILMLRKYYSVKSIDEKQSSTKEEIISLRAFVLLLIKQIIIKDDGVTDDELKSILVYLAVEDEEENYFDVLQLLLSVMCEIPASVIPCFDVIEGFQVFFKLLVAHDEKIRICSLKILCAYMQQLPVKRKLELVDKHSFISKIGQKLSIFDMTMMTYNALFEFLTARPSKILSENRHALPDATHIMYHPTVLPIIVSLLLKGRNSSAELNDDSLMRSTTELTIVFLSDLVILLSSVQDNKRLLLQLMCWQDWLFALAYFEPTTKDEHKITDTVFSIIKMLLYYAIQNEKEGWRVWVDTLSILHAKVSDYLKEGQVIEEVTAASPSTLYDDQKPYPQYIDQETGELNDNISVNKENVTSEKKSPAKSSIESDIRKKFFERLLTGEPATSVISGSLDNLRRTQSATNVNEVEANGAIAEVRPRSASPTVVAEVDVLTEQVKDNSQDQKSTLNIESDEVVRSEELKIENISDKQAESSDNENDNIASVEHNENDKSASVEENETDKIASTKENETDKIASAKETAISVTPGISMTLDQLENTTITNEVDGNDESEDAVNDQVVQTPDRPKTRPYVDIPEFNWSHAHQRLLTELLFSIEKDIQVWKTHTRKTLSDFVSSRENSTYIMNLCHMVSILSDSLIYCCGGLLPLLASATSQNFVSDVFEPCGGMSLDAAFSFLNRILDIIDVIAFSSSINFASVETHRNMSAGGVLRQCIRLVFCGSARNRVVCRQRERPSAGVGHIHPKTLKETQEAIKTLIASTKPPTEEDVVQNIPGHMTTITNPERLLQDSDINRLRALVYREVEDSRQSQYVALVVIYFVAVLMVARYRDILEHEEVVEPNSRRHSSATSTQEAHTPPKERSATIGAAGKETEAKTLEEKIEIAFNNSAALLREILFDFSHYLMKVLVGSRGQDLISEGLGSLKSEESTVELVMLLCSQEWQNALQRQAGTAFVELVDEGRLLSHSTRERIVITGSEAKDIMNERDNFENFKHAQHETLCTRTVIGYIEQYKTYDQFFKAKKKRNAASATQSLEKIFDVLTSEFGAWPMSEPRTHYQYYKLDRWEDLRRRRKRMVKNPFGTSHPEATLRPGSAEVIPPEKPQPLKYHLFAKKTPGPNQTVSDVEDPDDEDLEATAEERQPYQHQGSIVITTECSVISPGAVIPGTLAITDDSLYFTADEDAECLSKIDPQILAYNDCLNIKCSFINIVAIFSRRYILQNKAIEVFLANRRSFLLAFESHDVVKKILQYLPPVGVGSSYGLPRTKKVSLTSPRMLFKKSNMLQRWQNREISNFEYLMFLNTIAGRTYNDLNQYFIFPWILKNYETKELDLKDPQNYRDLSKPIGALNPFRLAQFIERFNSWDESGDIPAFHYGTHYSTSGFVLNWLVRIEPFASLFLSLQGGKFDHPLRTFSSIKRAWDNCQNDTSDVKELIPELFYLPDMLRNSNKFVFGDGEDGSNINDVVLPAWARSAEHFVKLHSEALESDYVSENLHKWIDLIFGYKQKGKDAEHSANVFYHLTYEGSVNLDAVTDPVTKEALIQQIKSFGQTPSQLLTTPHPPRNVLKAQAEEPHKSIFLSFSVTPEVPITFVSAYTSPKITLPAIITISCNQFFSVNKWINFGGNITSYQSLKNVQIEQDPSLETLHGRLRRQLGEPLHESVTVTSSCFTVTSDNRFIFTCGYWDKSFKCFSTDTGKLTQCVFGHWDVVTCLAYSDDDLTSSNAIIVSGSLDATVLVWIWDHKRHRIVGPDDVTGHGSTPIAICIGHELPVTCVDVNASMGVIASGSLEGACLLHSLSGELLRILKGPPPCQSPRLINISNEGRVLVNYSNENGYMAMFSNNGRLLSYVKLTEQNLAVAFTSDGCFFVTGGFSRCFQIWRSYDLFLLSIYPPCDGSIRSIALTPDQKCMAAGLSTGSIIAMAMDFSMWPRLQEPVKPVVAQSTVPTTDDTHAQQATQSLQLTETENNTEEEGAIENNETQAPSSRSSSPEQPTTPITDKVPDDDTNVDLSEVREEQTTILTAPVPDSDVAPPKTLLQTVKEAAQVTENE